MADDFKSTSRNLLRKKTKTTPIVEPEPVKVATQAITVEKTPERKEVKSVTGQTMHLITPQVSQLTGQVQHRNFKIPRELRTVRACVAMKPSLYTQARDLAKSCDISFSDLVDKALAAYIENYTD